VYECTKEEHLLEELNTKKIDLLLLGLANANTIELCKRVRAKFNLCYIPIILLTEKEKAGQKIIEAIEAGADDYVEKATQIEALLIRMKANLWRAKKNIDLNPLTKLPGNTTTLRELEKRIKKGEKFSVGYIGLNGFKEYNSHYGFSWGDKIIKHTASLISKTIEELGTDDDFLGHLGADNFIFITDPEGVENICKMIINEFNSSTRSFYKEEDLKRGYILLKNREGKLHQTPLLAISIGVVTNKTRPLNHVGQIIQIVTELKDYAKTFPKSIYIIDRRKD
jgi:diguanylate cyclase (GGDEF)-like protein